MSLVTNSVKFRDRSIAWQVAILFSRAKMWPLVFDIFYLHKYSHGFIQFPWLIIQFFFEKHWSRLWQHYFDLFLPHCHISWEGCHQICHCHPLWVQIVARNLSICRVCLQSIDFQIPQYMDCVIGIFCTLWIDRFFNLWIVCLVYSTLWGLKNSSI